MLCSKSHPNLQEGTLASADQDFESGALRSQPLCDCDGSLLFQPAQSAVRWGGGGVVNPVSIAYQHYRPLSLLPNVLDLTTHNPLSQYPILVIVVQELIDVVLC